MNASEETSASFRIIKASWVVLLSKAAELVEALATPSREEIAIEVLLVSSATRIKKKL